MASKSKNEARIKDELECQQKWHEAYVKEKRKRDNRKSRIQKEIAKIEKRIYQYNEEKIKAQRNILNKKSAKIYPGPTCSTTPNKTFRTEGYTIPKIKQPK